MAVSMTMKVIYFFKIMPIVYWKAQNKSLVILSFRDNNW